MSILSRSAPGVQQNVAPSPVHATTRPIMLALEICFWLVAIPTVVILGIVAGTVTCLTWAAVVVLMHWALFGWGE